jgi:hypothetical protein
MDPDKALIRAVLWPLFAAALVVLAWLHLMAENVP